jgi:hypothetical protein
MVQHEAGRCIESDRNTMYGERGRREEGVSGKDVETDVERRRVRQRDRRE